MRVLIACEFSGTVRDAFRAAGHDAMSCDILPTEAPGPHYQGDVRDVLGNGWDVMVAHPPCTYLTNAGVRWLHEKPGRWAAMIEAAVFFRELLNAPIPRVAIENPVMHGYARMIVGRRADQIIQPHMFGTLETKATGLWLRGLPPLIASEDGYAATMHQPIALRSRIHYTPPGPDRGKLRSITYQGIADAMAQQWGAMEAVA